MDSGYHTYLRLSNTKLNERDNLYSCLYVAEDGESEEIEEINTHQEEKVEEQVEEVIEQLEPMPQAEELEEEGWEKVEKKKKQNKNIKKKHVGLWYNDQSWQYKLANDRFVFKDTNMSVLEKYDLLYVKKMFVNAKNNYKRNKAYHKLMIKVTLNEWDIIKDFIEEVPVDKPKQVKTQLLR